MFVCEKNFSCCDHQYWDSLDQVEQEAKECGHLIEVAPVVHGVWLKTQEPLGWHDVDCVECSACHDSWVVDEDYGYDFLDFWHYCPNCGAKMDLE